MMWLTVNVVLNVNSFELWSVMLQTVVGNYVCIVRGFTSTKKEE